MPPHKIMRKASMLLNAELEHHSPQKPLNKANISTELSGGIMRQLFRAMYCFYDCRNYNNIRRQHCRSRRHFTEHFATAAAQRNTPAMQLMISLCTPTVIHHLKFLIVINALIIGQLLDKIWLPNANILLRRSQ